MPKIHFGPLALTARRAAKIVAKAKADAENAAADAFLHGYAVAAAITARHPGCTGLKLVEEGGFSIQDLRDAGCEAYDVNAIEAGERGAFSDPCECGREPHLCSVESTGNHGDVDDDNPCPKSDPDCMGDEDQCHDACEAGGAQ